MRFYKRDLRNIHRHMPTPAAYPGRMEEGMRNNPKGGMCTSRTAYSLYCPLCGKPAATKTIKEGEEIYMHFTRIDVVYHIKGIDGKWKRKRKIG